MILADNITYHWYVAMVRSCQEKTVQKRLSALGVETYVAKRMELRQWSDRKVVKERILIPRMVFVRCTERTRLSLFGNVPYLMYFMADKSDHKPVTIPDQQMASFQRVVGDSPMPVEVRSTEIFVPGDKVEVIRGPLAGLQCEVSRILNKSYICIKMGMLGTVVTEIPVDDIVLIKEN